MTTPDTDTDTAPDLSPALLAIPLRTTTGATLMLTPQVPAWSSRMDVADAIPELADPSVPTGMRTRLLMALIGILCGGQRNPGDPRNPYPLPIYPRTGDLLTYGADVMDFLMGRWGVITPGAETGTTVFRCALYVRGTLPTEEGVQRARDFTGATGEPSPSGSA